MNPQLNPYLQAYMQSLLQQLPQQQAPQMSLPTIHADIIQVGSAEEVERFPVGAGVSQMFILRDDSTIFVKSANANGYTVDTYDKRPPAPPAPVIDPQTYVTKEELERRLNALKEATE